VAAIMSADRTMTEQLLAALVADVRGTGTKVVGLLADTRDVPENTCGAGVLRDIVSGETVSIRLQEAPRTTSCRLDADGVGAACSGLLGQIAASDLVVLSKFGKLEAMRQGLAAAFLAAFSAGKPVLTTVSGKHRDAWRAFAPDAVSLPAEDAALQQWWRGLQPH
jgi:nucleoside-triphosphatase THEP1